LLEVEGELSRSFPDGVRQGKAEVAGSQIDAVGLPDVAGDVTRQLAPEALEVILQATGHVQPCARWRGARPEAAQGPRDHRKHPEESRLRRRRPTASGGCSLPSAE